MRVRQRQEELQRLLGRRSDLSARVLPVTEKEGGSSS